MDEPVTPSLISFSDSEHQSTTPTPAAPRSNLNFNHLLDDDEPLSSLSQSFTLPVEPAFLPRRHPNLDPVASMPIPTKLSTNSKMSAEEEEEVEKKIRLNKRSMDLDNSNDVNEELYIPGLLSPSLFQPLPSVRASILFNPTTPGSGLTTF